MAILNKTCSICSKSFSLKLVRGGRTSNFCSKECFSKHRKEYNKNYSKNYFQNSENIDKKTKYMKEYYKLNIKKLARKKIPIEKKCLICHKDFLTTYKHVSCCSINCYAQHRKEYKKNYSKKYFESLENREKRKKHQKEYLKLNPEKIIKYRKGYHLKNKDKIIKRVKEHYLKNRQKKLLYVKTYNLKNKDKKKDYHKKYNKNRRNIDPQFKIIQNLRSNLYKLVTRKRNIIKNKQTKELIGCSVEDLKIHIENQFVLGMNWENYTYDIWHIDHIKPLSLAKNMDDIIRLKLMHYTNLQPLWAKDNIKKSDKYDEKIRI